MIQKPFYYLFSLILLVTGISCVQERLTIDATFCENKPEPLGVNSENIRFSWNMGSHERSVSQTAYQIMLSEDSKNLENGKSLVWDSGKTNSDQSILVNYAGPKLVSGEHVLPIFRKEFNVEKKLKEALVFVTGLGQYELHLNGQKVGNHFMAPGWTDYDDSNLYNIFDVTSQLKSGANAFGMMLGNGFYNIPNTRYRKLLAAYGNPKMILKLQLKYEDGSSETVVSDESWKVSESPVTYSSIFSGRIDKRNIGG